MDTGRNILLVTLEDCSRHCGQIYNKISNLAIKLIRVGIPLSAIATRNVGIVVNESNSGEAGVPLNHRLVIWISNKLSIVISMIQKISSANVFTEADPYVCSSQSDEEETYCIMGVLIR